MKFIPCYALTGGGSGALDAIDGAGLSDGDAGRVISDGVEYFYRLDASSGADEASPTVISPDSNAGDKRWLLQGVRLASIQLATGATPTEFSTDGTLGGNSDTAVPTEKAVKTYVDGVGGVTAATFPGFLIRPIFAFKDTDEIYIGAGRYHHNGTSEQIVYWDSQLTYQAVGLSNSTMYYVYLDDSAIVTLGAALLTASELTHSDTAPTWNAAKGAYYNGNDKWIFSFLTDGSGNIKEFFNDGGRYVGYADMIEDLALTDVDTSDQAVTLSIPSNVTRGKIRYWLDCAGVAGSFIHSYWKTTGQVGATGHRLGIVRPGYNYYMVGEADVFTNSSQSIDVFSSVSSSAKIAVYTSGYYLPRGL